MKPKKTMGDKKTNTWDDMWIGLRFIFRWTIMNFGIYQYISGSVKVSYNWYIMYISNTLLHMFMKYFNNKWINGPYHFNDEKGPSIYI
jgi:hypothetical protein